MAPSPLYPLDKLNHAFFLRYGWTGWPSKTSFGERPPKSFFDALRKSWKDDDIHLRDVRWSPELLRFRASVSPRVSPVHFTARMKGRLEHALRKGGYPCSFSRKTAMRTIGKNRRFTVENYVGNQVEREGFVDSNFRDRLEEFTISNDNVDLSTPVESAHGRYWYNLHIVLNYRGDLRVISEQRLTTIREWCFRIADCRGYRLSSLSLMPDHVHLAIGGAIDDSPGEMAAAFMNNLAYAMGQKAIWQPSFYVGSFSEYDIGACSQTSSPPA